MEVNSTALKLIIKECCRSLSYGDEERQFSFTLRPSLADVWVNLRDRIHKYDPNLNLTDFNNLLDFLENPKNDWSPISFDELNDTDILNGEVIEAITDGEKRVFIRMKQGQYLDLSAGSGFAVGSNFSFCKGKRISTAEGYDLGICHAISVRCPGMISIAMARYFIGKYYTAPVAESLWPLYNLAAELLSHPYDSNPADLLQMSRKLRLGLFPMLHIISAACCKYRPI